MEKYNIDQEAHLKVQKIWDGKAEWYAKYVQSFSVQGMTTCAIMSDMPKCKTVLEVGCGPGSHSLILASSFLNRDGGVLVSTDVSSKMIQKLKETYEEESDYGLIPSNKSFIDTKSDYSQFDEASSNILKNKCDIEDIVQAQGKFNKFVFGCQANNECLPFPDNYFEAYIAPLSLLLMPNHHNMISEAFRVTTPGARSVFTIWSLRANSLIYTCTRTIVNRYVQNYVPSFNEYFPLWLDKPQLQKDFENAGFTGIKMWEQPNNIYFENGEEYMKMMGDNCLKMQIKEAGIAMDEYDKLRQESIDLFDKETGTETSVLKTWECGVILAFKPEQI